MADPLDVIDLDYAAGSIGVDLLGQFSVTRVTLAPDSPLNRAAARNIRVYSSPDNCNFNLITGWTLNKDDNGQIEIVFASPVSTRFIKIKSLFDNRDGDFNAVNQATFKNAAKDVIKVYYLIPNRQESYLYDAIGNRTSATIVAQNTVTNAYTYYDNSSRVKSNGKYNFEYDNNGNMTQKTAVDGSEVWIYGYDLLNRLVTVQKNGVNVASYLYDESGLRVEKTGTKGTVDYVYDTGGNVLYQQEGRNYTENVYVLGKHFARVDGNLDNPGQTTKYFLETDHLGSTVAVTDVNGSKVWDTEYTPFGDRAVITGSLAGAISFTGKDLDEDTGLYYYNARWYDADLGRFITEDNVPITPSDPMTLNYYTYCDNDPMTKVDPSGHEPIINAIGDWVKKGIDALNKWAEGQSNTSSTKTTSPQTKTGPVDEGKIKDGHDAVMSDYHNNPGSLTMDKITASLEAHKVVLTDAERLRLCAELALDQGFNPTQATNDQGQKVTQTHCNDYTAEVYSLYTGSDELKGKEVLANINSSSNGKLANSVNGEPNNKQKAQELANQGIFVVA